MVALRLTCAVLVGLLGTSALAEGRRASFTVSVQVVAPLRKPGDALPASFIGPARSVALPCGAAGSAACTAAVAAAGAAGGAGTPVLATVLTDGAPTAIVER
jgi:hypothetical protein